VTNAANHERDLDWFRSQADGFDVELYDRAGDYAMLAVQGPLAREIVQATQLSAARANDRRVAHHRR